MQALPPKYVRFVVVHNQFSTDMHEILQVTGTFQSGHTETHPLPQGATARIEHEHDQGSFKTVDAVTNVTVALPDGAVLASQDFASEGGVKSFQMTVRRDASGNSQLEVTEN